MSQTKAGHGNIYLHVPIQTKPDLSTNLVSNTSYRTYRMRLAKEFRKVKKSYGIHKRMHRPYLRWASVSHDEMWALALAINNSLPILKSKNLSIDSYKIGEHETTSVIAEELAKLNFQGASGHVKFTNRHVPHEIKISCYRRLGVIHLVLSQAM